MAATGDCESGHWPEVLPKTMEGTGEKAGVWSYRPAAHGALDGMAGIQARNMKVEVLGDSDIKRSDFG